MFSIYSFFCTVLFNDLHKWKMIVRDELWHGSCWRTMELVANGNLFQRATSHKSLMQDGVACLIYSICITSNFQSIFTNFLPWNMILIKEPHLHLNICQPLLVEGFCCCARAVHIVQKSMDRNGGSQIWRQSLDKVWPVTIWFCRTWMLRAIADA